MKSCFLALLGSVSCFLLLSIPCSSLPLCTDSKAPYTSKTSLAFCGYTGSVCCNSTDDLKLQKQFKEMNVSDTACASVLKSILCSKCDKYSAELFRVKSTARSVPVLCNSTVSMDSSQSTQASSDYCSNVWDSCQNVSLMNSLFAPSLKNQAVLPVSSNSTKMNDFWQSKTDFCNAFGGPSLDESVCFAGEPVTLNKTGNPSMTNGMCLEKLGNVSYLNMVPHPDGSNRAFFSDQPGKIWLVTIPEVGSGGAIELGETTPFLDLTDEVHFDTEFGMMGLAIHPDFTKNGRIFASFNCDKVTSPSCSGRCSCNSDVGCDPSKLGNDNGAQPCQYQTVIAEYTANGTTASPSTASPSEVRRIFTMGLPFTSHHGGQILFGPSDGYLYFMMGDGGGVGDPHKFSQNKKSLLGKIMRLDVDVMPSAAEASKLGLWGNYSIPKDNPYTEDADLQPEIWAMGMRNPWRCSFDSARPSYFMCADVGQDVYEEVNIVTKAGNYGWNLYEGPFATPNSGSDNTTVNSLRVIDPVMGYNHSQVNKNLGSASITGGYFYRSTTDPCMTGRYLFGDLYANNMWAGTEDPENSGSFNTTQIPFSCAKDSPLQCKSVSGSSLPSLGYIFSYGEDNNKDVFILASSGVYRLASPDRCNYSCSKLTATSPSPKTDGSNSPSHSILLATPLMFVLCSLLLALLGNL